MIKKIIAIVMVFSFVSTAQARVWLDVDTHVNSIGQDVYVVTANSDGNPITSIGINVQGDGNLAQYHPVGFDTLLADYNAFFGAIPVDHDTQALFSTAADNICLTMCAGLDTTDELRIGLTGFAPFNTRPIVQIVLTGGQAVANIGLVVYGQEYSFTPYAQGTSSTLVPEPASLSLITIACIALSRRR